MKRNKVLIVDDSLTVRMDLAEAFEEGGFDVIACGTVAEVWRALATQAADVAVLDVMLPDGDGVDLLRELRGRTTGPYACGNLIVLMLSSETEVADRVRALKTGADEYVGKPYDRSYVVGRARELMRLRAPDHTPRGDEVLVIDDSPTFRAALRAALEGAGYLVLEASNGEEGLRAAADRRPGAIVVDGILPDIDGATVIRHVRLDPALRATPCLLLTGIDDPGAELRALDSGADAFVRKADNFELLLARLAAALRAAAPATTLAGSAVRGPHRILAIDDSSTYLNEVAAILRGEGYDVIQARSGEHGLDLLAVQPVDCILLDVVMPGLGGEETCRRIKSAPGLRDIPLIMLTGIEDRAAMLDGLGAGADDYVWKSSGIELLKARVRAQIRRKQLEDEGRKIREQVMRTEYEANEARVARELARAEASLAGELERRNRELEAFSYSVSHDLRAPLRTIGAFTRALAEDYGEVLDATGNDYLRRVKAAADRMTSLVDDLLRLSQVTRAPVRRQRVDLAAIGDEVAAELRARDPDRAIELRFTPVIAEGDAGLLRTVLENLLGNAWKFTSTRQNARIELGALPDGVTYYVRDNGIGFPDDGADRMFEPFIRLHADPAFPGTGIGLATVHRIVERHGGRIWAEHAPEGGAAFYFTLSGHN